MLRRGLCLLLTAALCLTTGCVADRAAMQAEAEQALLAQQEEALRQEESERRPGRRNAAARPGKCCTPRWRRSAGSIRWWA